MAFIEQQVSVERGIPTKYRVEQIGEPILIAAALEAL
jgi:hypothetical protein